MLSYLSLIVILYLLVDIYNTYNTHKSNIANRYINTKIQLKQIVMVFNFSYFNIGLLAFTFIINGFIFAIFLIKIIMICNIVNNLSINKLAIINVNNYLALLYILSCSECIYTQLIAYIMLIFLDPIKINN